MKIFPNPDGNEWLTRYNDLVKSAFDEHRDFKANIRESRSISDSIERLRRGKLTLHHIIPRSLAPELTNDPDNFVYLTFSEHMDAHYYLWKADPKYGIQLWFGCVFGRKHKIWNLPGGESEYEILKKDVAAQRRKR